MILQIIVGGLIGLAAGYGIVKFLGEQKERQATPKDTRPQKPARPRLQLAAPSPSPTTPTPLPSVEGPTPSTSPPAPTDPSPSTASLASPIVPTARDESSAVARLPESVDLPSLVTTTAVRLAELPESLGELRWTIRQGLADVPVSAVFLVEADSNEPDAWTISFTADLQQEPPHSKLIAKLERDTDSLQFQWANAAGLESVQSQLRNCTLKLRIDDVEHSIALRRPQVVNGQRLNLVDKSAPLSWNIADYPRAESVQFEMDSPAAGSFEEQSNRQMVGKNLVFEFAELAGAQLVAATTRKRGTGEISLRLTAEFVEPNRNRYELTQNALEEMVERWKDSGDKAANSLRQAEAELAALRGQLKSLGNVKGNAAVLAKRDQALLSTNRRIKSVVDRIPTYQKRLAEAQARIAAAPKVDSFLKQHHGKPLQFRIVAQSGDERIVLVDAR